MNSTPQAAALNGAMSGHRVVFCGTLAHSTDQEAVVVLRNTCLGVQHGKIAFLCNKDTLEDNLRSHGFQESEVVHLKERQFLIPGFVDTHLHAPQFSNCGKGLDRGLLEWLDTYTFPTEARFSDLQFAETAYRRVVRRVLLNGTTTGCYFATIHTDATLVLCDIINEFGQRAYVGKVNMNQNSPAFYIEQSTEHSVMETKRFIEEVRKRKYDKITPIITPRFAISCTEDLLKRLGDLAHEYQLPVQTHICETEDEINFVAKLFPSSTNYSDVYDKAGLMTSKTVLAHGIYLTEPEVELVKERKCGISHCPNSNLSIRSGVLDAQKLLQAQVKVGLGTDISGGYHPSMLDAIRTAVFSSNIHHIRHSSTVNGTSASNGSIGVTSNGTCINNNGNGAPDKSKPVADITYSDGSGYDALSVWGAFRLATLGGAKVLGLEDKIGNFEVGKELDALLIDLTTVDSIVDVLPGDSVEDGIEKYLFTGDDRNILSIYVGGKIVYSKSPKSN
ncbi:guanine deaminase-like isoform X2 [Dreissena polymorpha]|uniref:guanine deaminase-like isoform X2 n=1 Tax=Dreissena polymorpha TaxID=45954 RepID=UPI002264E852|nr:guanine deaminase-like isoform X2 [Dreissena polymorpha]